MLNSELANILLYTPYNREYSVPTNISERLTMNDFFTECYYIPDFDKAIEAIEKIENEEETDNDYLIDKDNLIGRLHQQKTEQGTFINWINNNGIGVYAVCGEAGTGKTTYLHHLAYRMQQFDWIILDLAYAAPSVQFCNWSVPVPLFDTLNGKVLSVVLQNISNYFTFDKSNPAGAGLFRAKITDHLRLFDEIEKKTYLHHDLIDMYDQIKQCSLECDVNQISKHCAKVMKKTFEQMRSGQDQNYMLDFFMQLLQLIIYTKDTEKKHIIIFDNIERYIGTDEIYNNQIHVFMSNLRHFTDRYNRNYGVQYSKHFQYIVSLRDSTLRSFTPQQISDFLPHKLDLSDWFPTDKIVDLKQLWLSHHEDLLSAKQKATLDRLQRILSDQVISGKSLRGLQFRLSMLFNNNKRLLLDYTLSMLEEPKNVQYLEKADALYSKHSIPHSFRKFAYRTIIWKLICDRLQHDALFKLLNSAAKDGTFDNRTAALSYIRQALTILSNARQHNVEGIVSLDAFLRLLYRKNNPKLWFFDVQSKQERQKLAIALYILSYCNRHENHWFRFINIVCRSNLINNTHINSSESFEKYLFREELYDHITMQITSAGIAYLGFIVQSFEQFSSFFLNYPPLLASIPTRKELLNQRTADLQCVRIVKEVGEKTMEIQRHLNNGKIKQWEICYYQEGNHEYISYVQRIKYAHSGYIGNFAKILEYYFSSDSTEVKNRVTVLCNDLHRKTRIYYGSEGGTKP